MGNRVFISYGHPDLPFVRGLAIFLEQLKIDIWFDKKNLLGGEQWDKVIKQEIKDCAVFLTCLSTNVIDRRGYFNKELYLALEVALTIPPNQLYILPVRLDDCPIPDDLKRYHVLTLSDEDGPNILLKSLSVALKQELKASDKDIKLLLDALLEHLGADADNVKLMCETFIKGSSEPKQNVDLIEQIANSRDSNRTKYLTELLSNDFLATVEAEAIHLALAELRQGKKVENLFGRLSSKHEKEVDKKYISLVGDKELLQAIRMLLGWLYYNRKNHPDYERNRMALIS